MLLFLAGMMTSMLGAFLLTEGVLLYRRIRRCCVICHTPESQAHKRGCYYC